MIDMFAGIPAMVIANPCVNAKLAMLNLYSRIMAKGRTISASILTAHDTKVIELCAEITAAIVGVIPEEEQKKLFLQEYGRTHKSRDAGAGRGAGSLQRDAVCTRGRTDKSPFSNRNLRWHPLMVAAVRPGHAKSIERIEIDGADDSQVLVFVVKDTNGNENRYPADRVHEMPERYVALPEHWMPHLEKLKYWNDTLWTQNSCVISALEACNWADVAETYAVLGIAIATEIYGADFQTAYEAVKVILRNQQVDSRVQLPSRRYPTESSMIISCPLCKKPISERLDEFRHTPRIPTWQPAWRITKREEGEDSSLQLMHVTPLTENEIRHNAENVRYGHRWCNVSMTDHSLEETLDFMEYVVRAHEART